MKLPELSPKDEAKRQAAGKEMKKSGIRLLIGLVLMYIAYELYFKHR